MISRRSTLVLAGSGIASTLLQYPVFAQGASLVPVAGKYVGLKAGADFMPESMESMLYRIEFDSRGALLNEVIKVRDASYAFRIRIEPREIHLESTWPLIDHPAFLFQDGKKLTRVTFKRSQKVGRNEPDYVLDLGRIRLLELFRESRGLDPVKAAYARIFKPGSSEPLQMPDSVEPFNYDFASRMMQSDDENVKIKILKDLNSALYGEPSLSEVAMAHMIVVYGLKDSSERVFQDALEVAGTHSSGEDVVSAVIARIANWQQLSDLVQEKLEQTAGTFLYQAREWKLIREKLVDAYGSSDITEIHIRNNGIVSMKAIGHLRSLGYRQRQAVSWSDVHVAKIEAALKGWLAATPNKKVRDNIVETLKNEPLPE